MGKESAAWNDEQRQIHQYGVNSRRVDALHAGDKQVLIGIGTGNQGKSQKIRNPVRQEELLVR